MSWTPLPCLSLVKEWYRLFNFVDMRRSPNKSNKERRIIFVPDLDEEAAEANLLRLYVYLFFFNSDSTLFYNDAPPRDTRRQLDVINLKQGQTAGIRKRVLLGTPAAGPTEIRSAFMIEADQTPTAAACQLMTQVV